MYAVALTLSVEGLKTSKEEQHALFDCINDAGCDDDSAIGKWGDHLNTCPDNSFKDCSWESAIVHTVLINLKTVLHQRTVDDKHLRISKTNNLILYNFSDKNHKTPFMTYLSYIFIFD